MLAARSLRRGEPMKRIDPKAVFIAMLLSLLLGLVGSSLVTAAFSSELDSNMGPEQVSAALLQHTDFLLVLLFLDAITTVIGGYVAARLARGYPYFNALAIGLLGIALSIVLELLLGSDVPGWVDAISYIVAVPAALFGGNLAKPRNE
jgi:hypothetical protein